MPLRAYLAGEPLVAFKISQSDWEVLKRSEERKAITLPCCNSRAVVKTSSLGTQYFAHYRKSPDCLSESESKEHLRLKYLVAAAAEAAGWDVTTEFIGQSPQGTTWIADVFCIRGKAKVAIEIQLSSQTSKELIARQHRYAESGVRAAWFMKSNVYHNVKDENQQEFPRFEVTDYGSENSDPMISEFNLTLKDFVVRLLTGGIIWSDGEEEVLLFYMDAQCWCCKRAIKIPIGDGYAEDSLNDRFLGTVPNASKFYKSLLRDPGNGVLENLGMTYLGPAPNLKGNAPGFPFCPKCPHCFNYQSNYHVVKSFAHWCKTKGARSCFVRTVRRTDTRGFKLKESVI